MGPVWLRMRIPNERFDIRTMEAGNGVEAGHKYVPQEDVTNPTHLTEPQTLASEKVQYVPLIPLDVGREVNNRGGWPDIT